MSHVTYEWVMSHINESCHIWMSHVTHECHTCVYVLCSLSAWAFRGLCKWLSLSLFMYVCRQLSASAVHISCLHTNMHVWEKEKGTVDSSLILQNSFYRTHSTERHCRQLSSLGTVDSSLILQNSFYMREREYERNRKALYTALFSRHCRQLSHTIETSL